MVFKDKKINNLSPGTENILDNITKRLLDLKLPNNLMFVKKQNHMFPDGYFIYAKQNERIFILKDKNTSFGIFKFDLNYIKDYKNKNVINPTIVLDFVQGIKQNNNVSLPKKWPEIIVNSFLFSCVPTITKDPHIKVRYGEFIPFRDGKDRNADRKKHIDILKKEIEIEIKMGRNNSPKSINLKNMITVAENRLKFVNALRDRYFDKEGFLNPNKKRVKEIYNLQIKKTNKPKYVFKKKTIQKLKLKKITIKRRL